MPGATPKSYASSTSIFFAVRSSFTMRKLRTWPVRTGSAFGVLLDPLFHRACSIELSEDRSAFPSFGASIFAGAGAAATLQVA
jgi:hypothetical protein